MLLGGSGPAKRSPQKEYSYIDLLRCMAVYMVIIFHCASGYVSQAAFFGTRTWWACLVISSFSRICISLFFMISGFLLLSGDKARDIRSFYRKRFARLALPFLFWDAAYFLERCMLEGIQPDIVLFFQELAGKGSRYHLWFVYQILALYLLAPFLKKIVDHSSTRELVLFLALILLQPTVFRFLNIIQSTVNVAPFRALVEGFAGFFLLGYLLGAHPIPRHVKRAVYLAGCVGLVVNIVGNYRFSSPDGIALYFSENYAITQYMMACAVFLWVKETSGQFPAWLLRWAKGLSGLTFGIYFIHVLVLDAYGIAIRHMWPGLPDSIRIAVSFAIVPVFSTVFVYFFSKAPVLKRLI